VKAVHDEEKSSEEVEVCMGVTKVLDGSSWFYCWCGALGLTLCMQPIARNAIHFHNSQHVQSDIQ